MKSLLLAIFACVVLFSCQAEKKSALPALTLHSLAGGDVALSSFSGKPILLNFWSPT